MSRSSTSTDAAGLAAATLLCLAWSGPLWARDDATQLRLNDIDARLARLERILANDSLLELSRRVDALETQQRQERGELDELQHGAELSGKQQRDLYADLQARLARLEAQAQSQTASAAAGGDSAGAGAAADDRAAYDQAFAALKGGDYARAITRFTEFMAHYPDSLLLDNAQYWLGEAYYVTRSYERAAAAFRSVGEHWPDSRKAPDALLKLGYTQQEQKQPAEARRTLQQVVERYPGSAAAQLAGERLARLGAEPH